LRRRPERRLDEAYIAPVLSHCVEASKHEVGGSRGMEKQCGWVQYLVPSLMDDVDPRNVPHMRIETATMLIDEALAARLVSTRG
jgi:hypothetical protein